jgi:mannose-6-phosphate isomerase-like protein (cupin superfamily)
MKSTAAELLKLLPALVTKEYPAGEPYTNAFEHGTMSVEMYAPTAVDIQTTHEQDELYFIHAGYGEIVIAETRHTFEAGTVFFVAAGTMHRFENFSSDFSTWVVFWGPKFGE